MRLKLTLKTQANSVLAYEHHHALPKNKAMTPPQYMDIKILSKPKKWSAIVPSEARHGKDIRTIGFRFDFEITAPIEWLTVGFAAGFGGNVWVGLGIVRS